MFTINVESRRTNGRREGEETSGHQRKEKKGDPTWIGLNVEWNYLVESCTRFKQKGSQQL